MKVLVAVTVLIAIALMLAHTANFGAFDLLPPVHIVIGIVAGNERVGAPWSRLWNRRFGCITTKPVLSPDTANTSTSALTA